MNGKHKEEVSDNGTEHGRLRDKWNELWKEKHGLTYAWAFKEEDGMLKTFIAYVKQNFRHEDMERKAIEIMKEFFATRDESTIKRMHPFSWLVKDRARYAKKTLPVASVVSAYRVEAPKRNGEFSEQELIDEIVKAPITWMKGFLAVRGIMKRKSPRHYEMYKRILLEMLGKERSLALFEESQKREVVSVDLERVSVNV